MHDADPSLSFRLFLLICGSKIVKQVEVSFSSRSIPRKLYAVPNKQTKPSKKKISRDLFSLVEEFFEKHLELIHFLIKEENTKKVLSVSVRSSWPLLFHSQLNNFGSI